MQIGRFGEKPRDRCLAAAGRSPKDHRMKTPRRHHAADRPVAAEEVILADHVFETLRAQPVGERPWRLVFEEPLGVAGTFGGARRHYRTVTEKSWPPRLMPNVHGPWD